MEFKIKTKQKSPNNISFKKEEKLEAIEELDYLDKLKEGPEQHFQNQ